MGLRTRAAATVAGMVISASAAVGAQAGFELPALPERPALPAPEKEGSVPMGDPAKAEEVKLDFPIAPGPFEPTWDGIARQYPGEPAWLREAKFGIWVHFGAQSAGESGDWYARRLYQHAEPAHANHLKRYGHPSEVGYKEVLRDWNPRALDPAKLVDVYRAAGARYLILQGVHHDNFDNWDSRYQPWNSVKLGPKRDLIGEWSAAARKADLRYGIAFHHEYTWWWYQPAFGSDATGPKAGMPYDAHLTLADGKGKWWEGLDPRLLYTENLREYADVIAKFAPAKGIFTRHGEYAKWYATWWALRMMDAVENYDPDFIYTDGNSTQPFSGLKSGTGMKSDAMQRTIAHYYNRAQQRRGKVDVFSVVKFHPPLNGIVNTREANFAGEIKRDQPWIGETPVGDWFYGPGFTYDAGAVVKYVIECAARDGGSAVCVSLRPDGSLDEGSEQMLRAVGDWMRANGDGIYGSRAWRKLGEGDAGPDGKLKVLPRGKLGEAQAKFTFSERDFRFTQGKDGAVYTWCMTVPKPGAELLVKSLGTDAKLLKSPVRSVKLLGHDAPLKWEQRADGLAVQWPDGADAKLVAGLRVEPAAE